MLRARRTSAETLSGRRISSLDTLRGLAFVLMVADHLLMLVLSMEIEPFNGRFFARLAEPLFMVLVGYFLVGRSPSQLASRLPPLILAGTITNLLVWGSFAKLDILATLLLALLLYFVLAGRLWLLLPALALVALDPTHKYLDYPLSIVVGQMALGMLLHKPWGASLSILALVISWSAPPPLAYTMAFTFPAALLVEVAKRRPYVTAPVATAVGQRALRAYVVQMVLIYAIAISYGISGGGSVWVLDSLKVGYGTLLTGR